MKVLFVIAPNNFRDEEYVQPKQFLEEKGIETNTASLEETAHGVLGLDVKCDLLLKDVVADQYDGIIFVGGPGATSLFNNLEALNLAKKAVEKEKTVGAICIAPTILANSGVLQSKKATVWPDNRLIENLKNKGAEYVKEHVVRDDNIVTADGPQSSLMFAKKFWEVLS